MGSSDANSQNENSAVSADETVTPLHWRVVALVRLCVEKWVFAHAEFDSYRQQNLAYADQKLAQMRDDDDDQPASEGDEG